MPFKPRKILHWLLLIALILLGAEVASRLDDWLQFGVPLRASPDRERDLIQTETWGVHGRPLGRFRKWKLNEFGFRSGPMEEKPPSDRPRILILGASETFGLYEDEGKEYPAQLAELLDGKAEVVNAAMAGITLKSMLAYWDHWAGKFGAKEVFIYPSPLFYLDDDILAPPREPAKQVEPGWQWRVAGRIRDQYHLLPDWLKSLREQWTIERGIAASPGEFTEVPKDRLRLFRDDLQKLTMKIRLKGAEPVLLTHAHSATSPPRPEDATYLRRMRMFFPRATPGLMMAFENQANEVIRDLAAEHHMRLVDIDREMSGHREWFADLVHFNNKGAEQMAKLLAE